MCFNVHFIHNRHHFSYATESRLCPHLDWNAAAYLWHICSPDTTTVISVHLIEFVVIRVHNGGPIVFYCPQQVSRAPAPSIPLVMSLIRASSTYALVHYWRRLLLHHLWMYSRALTCASRSIRGRLHYCIMPPHALVNPLPVLVHAAWRCSGKCSPASRGPEFGHQQSRAGIWTYFHWLHAFSGTIRFRHLWAHPRDSWWFLQTMWVSS